MSGDDAEGIERKLGEMNWNQTGMPSALVNRLGQRREFAEFKSVLNDAQNQVMQPVDVEAMAEELVKSGGRDFVEMMRALTAALANARSELENANRRYERLTAELERRGVSVEEPTAVEPQVVETARPTDDGQSEWEEWNRRFEALLG